MEQAKNETTSVALETIITNAVKIPGVKVNRSKFLAEAFAGDDIDLQTIIDMGPVSAGIPQERIEKAAAKLIFVRTSQSSVASFVAGIPGGFAMAATIPADVAQFFGMALRLAQELSYLYGASDLWTEDQLDDERVRNQLILYCGVMFGVSGAVSGVRVLSTQIAKTTLKKLPQKALTKNLLVSDHQADRQGHWREGNKNHGSAGNFQGGSHCGRRDFGESELCVNDADGKPPQCSAG